MIQERPVVISIGYGRHLFSEGNHERERMIRCAKETKHLYLLIFTSAHDKLERQKVSDTLTLCPTGSHFKLTQLWNAYQRAAKLVRSNKNDRVIITTQDPFEAGLAGYLLKMRYGIPLTVQEHADAFSSSFWRNETIGNRARYILGKYLLQKADVVRVVSKRSEETMKRLSLRAEITRLPVAIDTHTFEGVQSLTPDSIDEFWLLSVARFVPQKNIPLMLRAFTTAYQTNTHLRLRLVGQGPEQKKIEQLIQQLFPKMTKEQLPIKIEPWSNDVAALMRRSQAYVLSSNYEGWARVLIEAVLCELPIVTTDVGCAGEVIINEKFGLVVPVNEQAALTEAILRISTDQKTYQIIKENLRNIIRDELPGTRIDFYGNDWIATLE
ncbi:glycosyltransferase family 4 protein [Candidatus Parcubacteria bacterium]|nr:glycosyltransferase family 4 protein [Candidatus Parcubacteria bacterium]